MSPLLLALCIFGVMLALMVVRVPIAAAMFAAGAFGYLYQVGLPPFLNNLNGLAFARFASYDLSVIPLFILMGNFATQGGISKALFQFASVLMARFKGGLAMAAVGASAAFGAICGSSIATAATITSVALPEMKRHGYSDRLATGTLAAGGTLGILIPPSVPLVIYAILTEQNIAKLFAAATIPGIIAMLGYMIAIAIYVRIRPGHAPDHTVDLPKMSLQALMGVLPIAIVFLVVFGGIYGGLFTASEAAAVMAFYVMIAEILIYKDVPWSKLPEIARQSMILVGAILIVLGTALGLTSYMIDADVPGRIFAFLHEHISSQWGFLALLNVFLLVVNMVEIFSAIVIVVPIIAPVATQYGIDPIHLGALFLLNLEIGYVTPPLGLNLFLSARRFDKPLPLLYRAVGPFWLLLVGALIVVTYWPGLSLWLPRLLKLQ